MVSIGLAETADPGAAADVWQFLGSTQFTVAFGVASVLSLALGLLAWWSARKQKRVYEFLFRKAEESLETEETTERLKEKKRELRTASEYISALQEKIRQDIPKEARRAVLLDRHRTQKEILAQQYESLERIGEELEALGETSEIPDELRRVIETEIRPDYLLQERRSSLKTTLSLITAGAAVASAVLPWPFGRWLSVGLLVLAVPVLLGIISLAVRHGRRPARRALWAATSWISGVIAVGAGVLAAIGLAVAANEPVEPEFLFAFFLIMVVIFGTSSWYAVRTWRKLKTMSGPRALERRQDERRARGEELLSGSPREHDPTREEASHRGGGFEAGVAPDVLMQSNKSDPADAEAEPLARPPHPLR